MVVGVYVCRWVKYVCKSVMYLNALYHLFAHPQISSGIRSYEPWIWLIHNTSGEICIYLHCLKEFFIISLQAAYSRSSLNMLQASVLDSIRIYRWLSDCVQWYNSLILVPICVYMFEINQLSTSLCKDVLRIHIYCVVYNMDCVFTRITYVFLYKSMTILGVDRIIYPYSISTSSLIYKT